MRAVVLESVGDAPVMKDVERPTPEVPPGHALVRVHAAGFCHHDALIMAGVLRRGVRLPLALGHEIAGKVERVGDGVKATWMGRDVVVLPGALGHAVDGGFADYVAVLEESLIGIPVGMQHGTAALAACPMGVALKAVEDMGEVRSGETVVVTGVSGGVGLHAAQVAHVLGARVIGVTSSPDKVEELEGQPWLETVVTDGEVPYADVVMALSNDVGADAVIDTTGAIDSAVKAVARGGRVVVIGQVSSGRGTISAAEIVFRQARIIGSLGAERRHVERVLGLMRAGELAPAVDRELPLSAESVLQAQGLLRQRGVMGRVVLLP